MSQRDHRKRCTVHLTCLSPQEILCSWRTPRTVDKEQQRSSGVGRADMHQSQRFPTNYHILGMFLHELCWPCTRKSSPSNIEEQIQQFSPGNVPVEPVLDYHWWRIRKTQTRWVMGRKSRDLGYAPACVLRSVVCAPFSEGMWGMCGGWF